MTNRHLSWIAGALIFALLCLLFLIYRQQVSNIGEPTLGGQTTTSPIPQVSKSADQPAPTRTDDPAPAFALGDVERPVGSFLLKDTDVRAGVCTQPGPVSGEQAKALLTWAAARPIEHKDAFVRTVLHIDATGRLPDCYLTRADFEAKNWPEDDLWSFAKGTAIGGDAYANRNRALPRRHNGDYVEADLDFYEGKRSPNRLVFVKGTPGQSLIWVSLDTFDTFERLDLEALL